MAINPMAASAAYQNQQKMLNGLSDDTPEAGNGPSFMDMVQGALKSASDTQNASEALQTQSLTGGKVELTDLVTAVANAELSLSTVVAVRDKVINAYNDIIKMAI
jgi:flagellar hook-basal body complex protein FliE